MGSRLARQGSSDSTGKKEALISMCVGWALRTVTPAHKRYCVFDLNAGMPQYHIGGTRYRGTTQTVMDKLTHAKKSAALWWCDIDPKAVAALEGFIPRNGHLFGDPSPVMVHVIRGCNAGFASTIPQCIRDIGQHPSNTRGVIIADPNGLDVPIVDLVPVCVEAPFLDVVIHVSSFKQVWAYWDKHSGAGARFRETGRMLGSFREVFAAIPKRSWLISEPFRPESGYGRDHVVLYGSNLKYVPPITSWGLPRMERTDSAAGQALLAKMERRQQYSEMEVSA